ncbi:Os02g0477550 [Oryza sativa Japonica Group]|uniref:Os02g0477550 protein n=2 Tax=Oryza sativa subsp. japonica TaxID=39947 RepID=Q6K723_ORYSJ|nr:hypothetical protein OsJ_06724 [Oryza sativa Japonica Group]BAD21924.1 hypothetical protein [Oryza sativa Japonica Group]BAD22051.1 hypothetical protein [Oryza sativa Japonica Group]BAS78663.1 Os02g0477550 [Oryza sativa Japonica Group]
MPPAASIGTTASIRCGAGRRAFGHGRHRQGWPVDRTVAIVEGRNQEAAVEEIQGDGDEDSAIGGSALGRRSLNHSRDIEKLVHLEINYSVYGRILRHEGRLLTAADHTCEEWHPEDNRTTAVARQWGSNMASLEQHRLS